MTPPIHFVVDISPDDPFDSTTRTCSCDIGEDHLPDGTPIAWQDEP